MSRDIKCKIDIPARLPVLRVEFSDSEKEYQAVGHYSRGMRAVMFEDTHELMKRVIHNHIAPYAGMAYDPAHPRIVAITTAFMTDVTDPLIEMPVEYLTAGALDLAVGMACGWRDPFTTHELRDIGSLVYSSEDWSHKRISDDTPDMVRWQPSADIRLAAGLADRNCISVIYAGANQVGQTTTPVSAHPQQKITNPVNHSNGVLGRTFCEAVCRAFVVDKVGNSVAIPLSFAKHCME